MASTYELAEPPAPEADAAAPEPSLGAPALVLLEVGEAVGVCDLDGECR
jgi:hypothetical protein